MLIYPIIPSSAEYYYTKYFLSNVNQDFFPKEIKDCVFPYIDESMID